MKKLIIALIMLFSTSNFLFAKESFITVSTTTSSENSGLLGYILPIFTAETGIKVKIIAKGTGAAIKDGIDGNVDAILVHDFAREEDFIINGYGTKRYYIMYNDFILIGPKDDPANAKTSKSVQEAFQKIADNQAIFISRGDDSGTHSREAKIWAGTKTSLESNYPTRSKWYQSIGQGMGKTIIMAEEKEAYTLSDRGTYYAMKYAAPPTTELEIISEGYADLLNPYGYIPVNPAKYPHVKIDEAQILGDWLVSEKGRNAIENFKVQNKQLFFPPEKE